MNPLTSRSLSIKDKENVRDCMDYRLVRQRTVKSKPQKTGTKIELVKFEFDE